MGLASSLCERTIEHMSDLVPAPATGPVPDVAGWVGSLAAHDGADLSDAERIDQLRLLESLKGAAAAAQARITEAFDRSQRAAAPPLKPVAEVSRNISSQVALARRESPARGQRHLGVALALVRDLPETGAALTRGDISEWRATLVVRETATLTREHRQQVDRELSGRLDGVGDRRLGDLARSIGYRLDPGAALRRNSKAESDRRVSVRPAPDTMCHVTGLLPVAQGVAVFAALRHHAASLRAGGDTRTIAQIMADTFFSRLTGQEAGVGGVEIQLVMTDRSLLRGDHQSAHVPGYGPVPASLARRLVREADRAWVRRLFTSPTTHELVATDSRRRLFAGSLRCLVVLRDQTCSTPWCDAPVAHVDHVRSAHGGGPTSAENGQGLCEACNYTKESRGWRADVVTSDVLGCPGRVVEITTPTGHRYRSRPPRPPGDPPAVPLEQLLRRLADDAA